MTDIYYKTVAPFYVIIYLEAGLSSQVVIIRRQSEVNTNKEYSRREKDKYCFQGKSARSQHWLKLYLDWVVENFKTRYPEFY